MDPWMRSRFAGPATSAARLSAGLRSSAIVWMLLCMVGACEAGSLPAGRESTQVEPAPAIAPPPAIPPPPASNVERGTPSESAVRNIIDRTSPNCHVRLAFGVVRFGAGEVIAPGEKLYGRGWLELEKDTRIIVRHAKTAREWSLDGPAIAAFCPRGREEVLLGSGTLEAEPGPGSLPPTKLPSAQALEVTIGTPFGTIAYKDARLTLQVSNETLRLNALTGDAWLTPSGPTPLPEVRVAKGNPLRRTKRSNAADAMAICTDARDQASSIERLVPRNESRNESQNEARRRSGPPDPKLTRALKWARASCTSAAAAALSELRGEERDSRLRELTQLEQRWTRVPPGVEMLQ
jgi:hypothetical protein